MQLVHYCSCNTLQRSESPDTRVMIRYVAGALGSYSETPWRFSYTCMSSVGVSALMRDSFHFCRKPLQMHELFFISISKAHSS